MRRAKALIADPGRGHRLRSARENSSNSRISSSRMGKNWRAWTPSTAANRFARRDSMSPMRQAVFDSMQLFESEEDAIYLANDTVYGLAGGVFTRDGARARRVIRRLRAGITWINTYHPTFNEAPWGGYKQSEIGRELGTYGYDAYTEVKQIYTNVAPGRLGWFKSV
jgi:acyl-CoA reductase-like NAD-dependent aldehyde dehydrogenase